MVCDSDALKATFTAGLHEQSGITAPIVVRNAICTSPVPIMRRVDLQVTAEEVCTPLSLMQLSLSSFSAFHVKLQEGEACRREFYSASAILSRGASRSSSFGSGRDGSSGGVPGMGTERGGVRGGRGRLFSRRLALVKEVVFE
jgi:hypothetical protein